MYNYTMKLILIALALLPLFAQAGGDVCINETGNQQLMCRAHAQISASYCERMTSFEFKADCVTMVKNRQREIIWKIKPFDVATADVRGDKKYIWQR